VLPAAANRPRLIIKVVGVSEEHGLNDVDSTKLTAPVTELRRSQPQQGRAHIYLKTKWRKRVRVERFRVLQTKGFVDSKTTSTAQIVNFCKCYHAIYHAMPRNPRPERRSRTSLLFGHRLVFD